MSRSAYGADTAWTRARPLLVALVLAAAVAIAYRQAISCGFVYDDATVVVENRHLRGGPTWENLRWAFTTFHTANWLPLTWASHQIDVGLFGLKPAGHHLVNVLLHAASAILLFRVLELLAGRTWPAALVAALFALHPLHVESVAWISERKDVLSALFWMLTLGAYLRYARRPSASRLLGTAALLALGLMAKPMLVTLPFALLLLDWWPLGRFRDPSGGGGVPFRALLAEKAPLFALSAASCAVTWAAQRSGDAVKSTALFPWAGRVENALASYAAYLAGTFWPAKLAVFYPYPPPGTRALQALAGLLLLAGGTAWAVLARNTRPYIPVGWFWFVGTLVPVIGIVQVGGQSRADRYTYLPLIGLFIVVAWAAPDLLRRMPGARPAAAAAAVGALLALAAATSVQVGYWRGGTELYSRALAVTRDNWLAMSNLAVFEYRRGRLGEAIALLERSLRINPRDPKAHCSLGLGLLESGRNVEALAHFGEALRLRSDYADARVGRGAALAALGRKGEALADLREALRLQPDLGVAHLSLANLLDEQGRLGEALPHYREALRLDPDDPLAHYNLAVALEGGGRLADAAREYREALRLDPAFGRARKNLAALESRLR